MRKNKKKHGNVCHTPAPRRDLVDCLAFDGRAVTATCSSDSIAVSDMGSVLATEPTGVVLAPASVVSPVTCFSIFLARASARRLFAHFWAMGDGPDGTESGAGVTDSQRRCLFPTSGARR
jgi:hypothetical protein